MPEGVEVLLNTEKLKKYEGSTLKDIKYDKNGNLLRKIKLPVKIKRIFSKGKKTFIQLEDNYTLIFSYGLTGEFVLDKDVNSGWIRNNEKYFVYSFITTKGEFHFSDVMRYGSLQIVTNEEELEKSLKALGPDILQDKISDDYLKEIYQKKKKIPITKVLVDQKIISGIGNIYKSDGLYVEKIYPLINLGDIKVDKFISLIREIKKIMKKSYKSKYSNDFENIIYDKDTDSKGNKVLKLKTPDGRYTSYVQEVQKIK